MKNKTLHIGTLLFLTVLMTSSVLAFGVSSPYWKGNPLQIYPGETKIVKMNYQNMGADAKELTVRATITKGSEIASVEEQEYTVRPNTKDTEVRITVSIPTSVAVGQKYQVTLTSQTVTPGAEGGVSLGVGMDTTFDVDVIAKPAPPVVTEPEAELAEETPETMGIVIFIALALIIIAIVLIILLKLRKKNKQ